jgi:DNA-binding NarL/FixJ family response regulator
MTLRVLLADDHALFRDGVAALLQARGFEIAGVASNGLEAIEQARRLKPDLALIDINMPRLDGLAATRILSAELPALSVVILTVSDDDASLFEAIKSGAKGYLLKNSDTATFFELLEGVTSGDAPISRRHASRILSEFARAPDAVHETHDEGDALSEREKEVLRLVSEGLTNRAIGVRLNLSENTIKFHLKNILQKLHMRNRAQAVAYALQSGLLSAG